jgi:hypothetical protein
MMITKHAYLSFEVLFHMDKNHLVLNRDQICILKGRSQKLTMNSFL